MTPVPPQRTDAIHSALTDALAPDELTVSDDSAAHAGHAGAREGGHYRVRIVSEHFRGLTVLQRHRLVYAALGELRASGIHALAIEARTRDELP